MIDKFLCRHWGDVQVAALNAATQSTWTTRARKRCRDEYEEEFLGDEEIEEMDEERGDVEEREKEVVLEDEKEEEQDLLQACFPKRSHHQNKGRGNKVLGEEINC